MPNRLSCPRSFRSVIVRLAVAVACGLAPLAASPATASVEAPAARPVSELLREDGSIDLGTGFSGALDLSGFRVEMRGDGAPVVVAAAGGDTVTDAAAGASFAVKRPASLHSGDPDDHWLDRFAGIPGVGGYVFAMAVMGGDLYVGGEFSTAGGVVARNIARWDGTSWSALGGGLEQGGVYSLAVLGSSLYAGGYFATAGGTTAPRIAKWDGSNWSPLGDGIGNGGVLALATVGTDLYAGGTFDWAGAGAASGIAKWDGVSWSAVGAGVGGYVRALKAVGSDLYVGGNFTTAGGSPAANVARWSGSAWSTLGAGTNGGVYAIAEYGGELWFGGYFTEAGGTPAAYLARWNGSAWATTNAGFNSGVESMVVIGGTLYLSGGFTAIAGSPGSVVARWNGSSWSALSVREEQGNAVALAGYGGELVVGGLFERVAGVDASGIARWNNAGWHSFPGDRGAGLAGQWVTSLAVLGGDLYVGGWITDAGGVAVRGLARWDGTSWHAVPGMDSGAVVWALVVIGSDLYVGGTFSTIGGGPGNYIAKWNGSSWSALGSGLNDSVHTLTAIGTDLYAGGIFTTAGGIPANRVARWDGSSWSALGAGVDGVVWSLAAIGADLYVGGEFLNAGGSAISFLARWNGAWSAVGGGVNHAVLALHAAGTDLYAGGAFSMAGGSPAYRIAKWNGSSWSALGSGMSDSVSSLTFVGPTLYAGGHFQAAGGSPAAHIAKWDGANWSACGSGTSGPVLALAGHGGTLVAGGAFRLAGGKPSVRIGMYTTGTCGNGIVDPGESCDPLALGTGTCCSASNCQLAPAGAVCRQSFVPCGGVETCDGVSSLCPVDAPAGAGVVCRQSASSCDAAETCDGTSFDCPADAVASAATICRAASGVCDVADHCDGLSMNCPADAYATTAVLCRASVHPCDANDFCPGNSAACSGDASAPGSTVCRPAADACDAPDTCDATNQCATDLKQPVATPCEDDGDACTPDLCGWTGECQHIDVDGDGVGENCDVCGDGSPLGQECDDGNLVNGDGCDENCTFTACGNGVVTANEVCDDGNLVNDDGCNSQCRVTQCGDGLVTRGQLAICAPGAACNDVCDSAWGYPFGARVEPSAGIETAFVDGADVWVGGEFGYDTNLRAVAKWNNGVWSALAGGLGDGDYVVTSIVKYGGQIHAGGEFFETGGNQAPARCLAKWTGSAWVEVGGGLGTGPNNCQVAQLLVSGPDLYVAGMFTTAGGTPAANIARWDGSAWHALGSGVDARVSSIVKIGADLYAGGLFTTAGGTPASYVARWDGSSWSPLGAGLATYPEVLVAYDGALYAGGQGFFQRWDGSTWTDAATIPVDFMTGAGRVNAAAVVGGDLVIAGEFTLGAARNIARYDGSHWAALGSGTEGIYSRRVDGLAVDGNRLIVVGEFEKAGGAASPHLAVWTRSACGEQCDDGNAVSGDGCDANCSTTACGNGIATAGEACDDGNAVQGDGCDSNCTASGCGNGIRSAGESCDDGNAVSGDGCENNCTMTAVAAVVGAGGGVATPPASVQYPVQAQVTTPTGGAVSIASAPEGSVPAGAFLVLGTVLDITAPDATAADPLVITLTVHSSAIPTGYGADAIVVTRDGVDIGDCTGPAGQAVPDPCIESRTPVGGDVEIRVLSSHASLWSPVLPALTGTQQKCANGVAKSAVGVTKTLVKMGAKCLKGAEKGDVDLDECFAVTAGAKAGKSMAKTAKSAGGCPGGVPVGYVDATTANLAAQGAGSRLVGAVLGSDMGAALEADPGGAACRAALVKSLAKVFLSEAAAFLACQKSGLAGDPTLLATADDLAWCLDVVRLDGKGKIAAAEAKLAQAFAGKCGAGGLQSGACSGAADAAACFRRESDCQVCRLFSGVAGFDRSCDVYDDGVANGSCAP